MIVRHGFPGSGWFRLTHAVGPLYVCPRSVSWLPAGMKKYPSYFWWDYLKALVALES